MMMMSYLNAKEATLWGSPKKAGNFNFINISTLLKRLDLEIAFVLMMLFCLQNEIGLDPGLGKLIHENFSEPILHTRYLECFLLISSPSNQQAHTRIFTVMGTVGRLNYLGYRFRNQISSANPDSATLWLCVLWHVN